MFLQNSRFTKVMSLTVVSALLINDAIACSLAIHSDDFAFNTSSEFFDGSVVESHENVEVVNVGDRMLDVDLAGGYHSTRAASGGPGQAEIAGSTANTGGGLVNTFTGDLAYSLPLMSVEGFPITLSYDPNIGMDQEASWVGLGWNLSLGSINRDMRGIPDDFQGDQIERIVKSKVNTVTGDGESLNLFGGFGNPVYQKKSGTKTMPGGQTKQTIGVSLGTSISGGVSFSRGSYFNNYTGRGLTRSFGLQGNVGLNLSLGNDNFGAGIGAGVGGGIGFSADTQNGVGVSKSGSFNASGSVGNGNGGLGLGADYSASKSIGSNSRSGIKTLNSSSGFSVDVGALTSKFGLSGGYGVTRGTMRTYGTQTFVPRFASSNIGSSYYASDGFNLSGQYFAVHAGGGYGQEVNSSVNRVFQYSNLYPAYGYQNHSKGQSNSNAMLDFNRGQSTAANSETTQLAFSVQTYDNFYCSAPGLNAAFRPYRYDVTEYHDPTVVSKSSNTGDIIEHNVNGGINMMGNYTGGYTNTDQNVSGNSSNTTSKAINGILKGVSPNETFNRKEYYLKTQGETKIVDPTLFNDYQGAKATKLDITFGTSSNEIDLVGSLSDKNGNTITLPSQNYSLYRPKNSIHYREYRFDEVYAPRIIEEVVCSEEGPSVVLRNDYTFATDEKKAHHTGAIEVVDESGMRYVFGIPVYNYSQSEVAFSASTRLNEAEYDRTSLLQYEDGDNSTSNNLGRAAAYEKTTIPAYVSSYLLTEMLSSDYIDRTGNGVSQDDQGNYYKLNYINPYEGDGNKEDIWKWRMPFCSDLTAAPSGLGFEYEKNLAYANRNSYSDKWDDMANYIYGEKEVWYAATVESKNMIAFFCLEDREDQFSAKNENGGLDLTKPGKLLKKIMLFSKNDLELNPSNAKALQIVEFDYDYSLCQKYVGNENTYTGNFERSGKLTLKRIYTYTGESSEGKAMPTEFIYSSGANNPDFAFNSSDRWGNYKPNDINKPNHEFPYSDQTGAANDNVKAWKLFAVSNTGGSKVEFEYDVDQYGFVQNQRAMRMFQVVGMSSTSELQAVSDLTSGSVITESTLNVINGGNHIYFRNPSNQKDHYNVMYFKFENPIPATVANLPEEVKKQYFRNAKGDIPNEIYFNMFAKLDNRSDVPNEGFEFVESTVKIGKLYNNGNFCGVAGRPENGVYNYGYVIIEPEDINQYKDKESNQFLHAFHTALLNFLSLMGVNVTYRVNPLQVANWQYARLNAPCNVYGNIDYTASTPTQFCDYHLENDGNIFGMNIYKLFNLRKYGMEFKPSKSVMRLFEPDNIKFGGNCRIASVTVHDNWDQYSGEDNTSYTYTYDYGEREETSTGVASYEPQVGNNENPFYQFKAYDQKRHLLPDERVYQKDPWGEMAFPGAVVGYSKVISGLFDGSVVGENHEEFYTLHDYPTIIDKTHVQRIKRAGNSAIKDDSYAKEVYGFSQGFYVETSDFHGKPKSSKTIGRNGETISTSEIEYYDFNTESLNYVDRHGNIITSAAPQDVDMHADSWKNRNTSFNQTNSNTTSIGVTFITIPIPPGFIPYPILGFKKSEIFFKYEMEAEAFTFNKVRHRYAVPKAIHTSYLGSYNTARNLYFDEATGDVLVSSLKDEYNDELFSMSYPAHWYYDQCKNMSVTDGMLVPNQDIIVQSASSIRLSSGYELHVGDQLEINDGTNTVSAWVLEKSNFDPHAPCNLDVYHLINANGAKLSGVNWSTAWFRVERTGVKNATAASMASITTKNFPNQSTTAFNFPVDDILSSSAVKLSENKNVPCVPFDDEENAQNYPTAQLVSGTVINPFLQGTMGNLRLQSSFAFQQERDESDPNTIRKNAPLVNYEPFYALGACGWQAIDEVGHPNNITLGDFNDWRELGEVNVFDEFGKPIQSTDQIAVSSAVQYGMNKDLKLVTKAQAVNAKATEIGFDGFEESYYFQGTTINYVDYGFSLDPGINPTAQIVSEKRHSGKYSLKITDEVYYDFRVEVPTVDETNIVNREYVVKDCNCLQGFAPQVNEEYVISTWVHENTNVYPFTQSEVQIEFFDANNVSVGSQIFLPQGAVIDGWQKIEGKYTVPSNAATLRIGFGTTNGSYYDDFRIHPFLAGMTTTVYDQTTLLPLASHDGYNYTTFYNYDENNQLVRVRVETIEGIKTISESEMGSFRKQ